MAISVPPEAEAGPPGARRERERTLREEVREELRRVIAIDALAEPGPGEVERALGAPVLAALSEDRKAARRAVGEQVPLTAVGGDAARELRRLASRLIAREAPVASGAGGRRRWRLAFRRA